MDAPATSPASRMPHSLILIFGMVVLAHVASYFIPAGSFERDEGGRRVIPGSYRELPRDDAYPALPPEASLMLCLKGFESAAEIIGFVFIVGGIMAILRATGAIDAVLGSLIRRFARRHVLLVVVMLAAFAAGSSTIGMAEEYMPLVPLLVAVCIAIRMDAIVAMGIIYIGAGIGYGCASINPFTVAIAKQIAGTPVDSGLILRVGLLAVFLAAGALYLVAYARRVRADPGRSLVKDVDYSRGFDLESDTALTPAHGIVLSALAVMIGVFVWGCATDQWGIAELSAMFLLLGIVAAVAGRTGFNRTAETFCSGAAEMTTTALLIGFARTIQLVFETAQVQDTIIFHVAESLRTFGAETAAVGMLVVQGVTNFLIPSGSGQAYVTMPLMAPLADVTGVGRETAIFAYQFGDGFTNMIVPTNALLMGMLGLARISYLRWLKFILPLMAILFAMSAIFVALSAGDAWYAAPPG